MRSLLAGFFWVVALAILAAAQGEEVTLAGKLTCAKCDLKTAENCQSVIVVKEQGKDVVYYFDESSHKSNHKQVCQGAREGSVTGKVSEKDGKKYIAVTKIDLKKQAG